MTIARFGFRTIQLRAFSDANFTVNEASLVEITPEMFEGGKEITVKTNDSVKTIVFANGSVLKFSTPSENLGQVNFEIAKVADTGVETTIEDLKLMLFPGSYKITNGSDPSKTSIVYTAAPGQERSGWEKALHMRLVHPTDKTNRIYWIEGRVAPSSNMDSKFGGSDISRIPVELSLIGGEVLSNGKVVVLREGDPDSGTTVS